MPAVSFMGKKFSCDAQFEVADEIDGDGLKLNLRVREMCKKYAKPHGPVLATLLVSVSNGRPNNVTKCKEVLAFLKEQVLPKTLKLISLKRIKKIKDEEKNEGASWLRCIWPGKTKKRKYKTKSNSKGLQTTRGYSSDTENYTEKCRDQLNLPDIEFQHQASNAGILATPMLSRPQFVRKANCKTKENKKKLEDENVALKYSLKRRCQEKGKGKDGKIAQKSEKNKLSQLLLNKNVSNGKEKHGTKKGGRSKEIGPQYVQNEQPDWKSCSDISASDSFVGFYTLNKATEGNYKSSTTDSFEFGTLNRIVESNETELQGKSNLLAPNATGISKSCPTKLCGVQKQNLESFAGVFVGRMCEVAISRYVKEKTKEIAKEFVADILRIVQIKIQQEKSKSQMCCDEKIELPSFSKVWKYSRVFPTEISESFKSYDSVIRDKEPDTCLSSKDVGDMGAKSDRQFEEFLEKKMVESLESSNGGVSTLNSFNSSSKLIDLETQDKAECFSLKNRQECKGFDKAKDPTADSSLKKAEINIHHSNEITSEIRNQELIENCDIKGEMTLQGEVETSAVHASNLEESRILNGNVQENKNNSAHIKSISEDCKIASIDSNSKGHDEFEDSAEMFCSGLSEDAVLLNNDGSLIPEEKSSETSYDQCVLKKLGSDKNDTNTEPCFRRRPFFNRTVSESQASERKQWSPLESGDSNLAMHSFHSSTLSYKTAPKYVRRSSSCPMVSEDDVMFESMQSHHRDVYDSLSKRTWIILHVHELWNGGKPMDAIKTCIDMTGMADVEQDTPYAQEPRDYALFLNILQQLPSSCSMWSLDLFVLVLPKLKVFISSQHHTSHVEMACGIIHVVLKKVAVVIRRTSKANKNKDKELKLKVCTNELKEIKDMTNDVIQAVKSGNRSNSEDPGSMKSVLKELQLALGTFFEQL